MPNEDNEIRKYNQGEKSIRSPFIIYADLECLLEKIRTCYNNLEESSTTEINKHAPSGYSLFTHCSFDKTKNKLVVIIEVIIVWKSFVKTYKNTQQK